MQPHSTNQSAENTARNALFQWLMHLPDGADSARAARSVVEHIDAQCTQALPASVQAFRRLLCQVANSTHQPPLKSRH